MRYLRARPLNIRASTPTHGNRRRPQHRSIEATKATPSDSTDHPSAADPHHDAEEHKDKRANGGSNKGSCFILVVVREGEGGGGVDLPKTLQSLA